MVRGVWKNTKFWSYIKKLRLASFLDCGLFLTKRITKEEFEVFAMMNWAVWFEVCKRSHAAASNGSDIKIDWALSMLDLYRKACMVTEPPRSLSQVNSDRRWIPPTPLQLRMDVDAGYDDGRNKFSVSAVVRNSQGVVLGAMAEAIRNPGSVKGAELSVIRSGMEFCIRNRLTNICIYSDSLPAVQALTGLEEDFGPNGTLVLEIRSLLASPDFISLAHVRRTANVVAHFLAREVLSTSTNIDWTNGLYPTWFDAAVTNDVLLQSL